MANMSDRQQFAHHHIFVIAGIARADPVLPVLQLIAKDTLQRVIQLIFHVHSALQTTYVFTREAESWLAARHDSYAQALNVKYEFGSGKIIVNLKYSRVPNKRIDAIVFKEFFQGKYA